MSGRREPICGRQFYMHVWQTKWRKWDDTWDLTISQGIHVSPSSTPGYIWTHLRQSRGLFLGQLEDWCALCVCVRKGRCFWTLVHPFFNLKIYIWGLVLKGFASSDGRNWFGIEYDRQKRGKWTMLVQMLKIKVFSCSQVFQKYIFMSAWSLSDTWEMPEN